MKLPRTCLVMVYVCATLLKGNESNSAQASNRSNRTPSVQTSLWGPPRDGVQCRVTVPVEIEQGMPIGAMVELRVDPQSLEPGVRQLNAFLPDAFLCLSLTNLADGQQFTLQPFDPTAGIPALDAGEANVHLDGRPLKPWRVSFPLVKLYRDLSPGGYDCHVRYSFPNKPTQWWRKDEAEWSQAGFWSGTVVSGPIHLQVRREIPKRQAFLLPKRLVLVKELMTVRTGPEAPIVPVPVVRFTKGDVEKVTVALRNGHFIGTKFYRNGACYGLRGGPPEPGDVNSIDSWYNYQGGDKRAEFDIELFETSDSPMHVWMPGPNSGSYRVLWRKSFKVLLSEQDFRKQPATALDLSKSKLTDSDLSMLKAHSSLVRLSLGNTTITDAGLALVEGLKRLEVLHLYHTGITDAGLVRLRKLTRLKELNLAGTKVTDVGLHTLRDLIHLESLDLAETPMTDRALENLKAWKRLTHLNLFGTQVGDAGLIHLRALAELEWLSLSGTQVTDGGLNSLKVLRILKWLRLDHTQVSDKGVDALTQALSLCIIER